MKRRPRKSLGEVAKFINGRAFKPSDWSAEGLPIIRIQNLTDPTVPANRFAGTFNERNAIRDGDLLVSWSATLDVFSWDRGDAVLNQHIFRVDPDFSLVQKQYLFFALKSVMDVLRSQTHGATMKHITKGPFERTEIPVPPLEEQERIVKLLDEADELRKLRGQADRRTAALIPALFHEMFGDPINNAKGWPIECFGNVCDCRLGKMLDTKQQTGKHSKPYLRNANVQWGTFDLTQVFQMDFDESRRETFRLRRGDLLICEGGEVGRCAIWNDELPECYFQKALHRARPFSDGAISEYLLYLMMSFAKNGGLKDHTTEATIAHLTGVKLKAMIIPLPPLPLQKEFAQRVSEIRAMEAEQAASRRRLDDFFQSMLHRAFRGGL